MIQKNRTYGVGEVFLSNILYNTRIRLQLLDTMIVILQNIYTSEGVSLLENLRDISFCKRWIPLA